MKKVLITAFATLLALSAFSQELSVDDAIERMKETSKVYITTKFQEEDETGRDQYVDAEVVGVHDFSDFSYGALMRAFLIQLEKQVPKVKDPSTGKMKVSSRAGQIIKENARLEEYAKDNMTKIAAYAAIVDFNGITKFHEKKADSRLFFYDWEGNVIGIKPVDYDRDQYKPILAKYMEKKAIAELTEMNDPLFLRKEYWISETVKSESNGVQYEMQWCYVLTKENIGNDTQDEGKFKAYYYQVQRGSIQTIKSIFLLNGLYEKDKNHIWFSYKDAAVESLHVDYKDTQDFTPGDYSHIDLDKLNLQIIEGTKVKKAVHALSNTPDSYEYIGDKEFKMTAPFISSGALRFTMEHN